MNMAILGIDWQPGDELVASDHEYGAIDNCIHQAEQRHGITVRRAVLPQPPSSELEIVDAFAEQITDRTRLLTICHIFSGTGTINPIADLARLPHQHGALLAVDGAHAPGMIPLDMVALGVDLYGGNCHKWLCSPKGASAFCTPPRQRRSACSTSSSAGDQPDRWDRSRRRRRTRGPGQTVHVVPRSVGLSRPAESRGYELNGLGDIDDLRAVLHERWRITTPASRRGTGFAQMVGRENIAALRERFASLSPDFERCVMGFIGGEVWTRPGLDLRTRSLCSIAILAALGRINALELNIRMALNNGATREEIVEAFFQVAIYAGFAAAWDGLTKADDIFRDLERSERGE